MEKWNTRIEFKGDFLNNMRHGYGKMIQRDGTVYEGQWENGLASGYGMLIQPDGFKNHGFFKDNVMIRKLNLEEFITDRLPSKNNKKKRSVKLRRDSISAKSEIDH